MQGCVCVCGWVKMVGMEGVKEECYIQPSGRERERGREVGREGGR